MPAILRSAAAIAAAAALTVAAPIAANAAAPYPPTVTTGWNGTACSGTTFTQTLPSGTFDGSRTLTESVSGAGQSVPVPGTFVAGHASYSLTSASDGAATIKLVFPASASGSYNVAITERGGAKASYGAITVGAAGSAGCATGGTDPSGSPVAPAAPSSTHSGASAATAHLATTGTYIGAGVVWSAAGAIVAGGVLALFAARRRRARQG